LKSDIRELHRRSEASTGTKVAPIAVKRHVPKWPQAADPADVRSLGVSGLDMLNLSSSECGGVEMWRGGFRSDISVPVPFV
jgi:hypothetical protein